MGIFDFFKNGKEENRYSDFDAANHFLPKIDLASFYKLKGYEVGWLMLEPINSLHNTGSEEVVVRRLSPGQKALHFIWYLDAQVTNGGFVQFYYNGYGKYVPAILAGLELIGDMRSKGILSSAHEVYLKKQSLLNRANADFNQELYEQFPDLEKLSEAYFETPNLTLDILSSYIKSHPNEFCRDEEGNPIDASKTGEVTSYFKNGSVKNQFNLVQGKLSGSFKQYFENQNIKANLNYFNGALLGTQEYYYENGIIASRESIDSEKGSKVVEKFDENGAKISEDHYDISDKRKGFSREWYNNGQLKSECFYTSQYNREGKWLKFLPNGQLSFDATFIDNKLQINNAWDKDGNQILENGTGFYSTYYEDTEYFNVYVEYLKHGLSKTIKKGKVTSEDNFENDERHGASVTYYGNGRVKSKTIYDRGKKISYEEFNMLDQPAVAVEVRCTGKDKFFSHIGIPLPDVYPQLLNADGVLGFYQFPIGLFEGYPQDFEMKYNYYVTVSQNGDVLKQEAISMDNARVKHAVDEIIMDLKFKPATLDGNAIESMTYCQFIFTLVESSIPS